MAFRIKRIEEVTSCAYIRLEGDITEEARLQDVTAHMDTPHAVVNVKDIDRINSLGLREWVNWASSLRDFGKSVFLVECSRAIISGINMVDNFVIADTVTVH